MNNLLDIRNLSKHYDGFDLQDINLTVPAGSVVGFIGSNGAGKTTTIKAALGLIGTDAGEIEMFGQHIAGRTGSKQTTAIKQRIGVVFDTCSFPEEMSVASVGSLMGYCYSSWDSARFDDLLAAFGLPRNKTVKELSRGMGMKLSLACALAHNSELLILDEATAGLDPIARDETLDVLREFMCNDKHGILMSSHITSDLEKIADYIVCIDKGRIVFAVEKDEITDIAGVAHCRQAEFDALAESGFFEPGEMRYLKHTYGTAVLVPDRFAFAENFKTIALDKADIDTYMGLMLKGDAR